MNIRFAIEQDIPAINEIYNLAVQAKFQTANTNPISIEERTKWFESHQESKHPIFVLEAGNEVTGWASLSVYRAREALMRTAEISYYIHNNHISKGYGNRLMKHCIDVAPIYNIKTLIAILLDRNTASINLLEKFNFKEWGRMPDIAEFNDEKCDHLYYGLHLMVEKNKK